MITAVTASNASISRKSIFSKPFTVNHFQFFPPFVVFPTVPLLPLTHAMLSLTTESPRRLVFVPDVTSSTHGKLFCASQLSQNITRDKNRIVPNFIGG